MGGGGEGVGGEGGKEEWVEGRGRRGREWDEMDKKRGGGGTATGKGRWMSRGRGERREMDKERGDREG